MYNFACIACSPEYLIEKKEMRKERKDNNTSARTTLHSAQTSLSERALASIHNASSRISVINFRCDNQPRTSLHVESSHRSEVDIKLSKRMSTALTLQLARLRTMLRERSTIIVGAFTSEWEQRMQAFSDTRIFAIFCERYSLHQLSASDSGTKLQVHTVCKTVDQQANK